MNRTKLFFMLSLFAILMTVFGSAMAQEPGTPAFKVSEVVLDDHIVLVTKDFPAGVAYVVGMGTPDDPSTYIAVAKFNSQDGGALGITVRIPEKFQGEPTINLLLKDENGGKIFGNFANIAEEAPVAEETVEEPTAEEPVEEPVEEPAAEEPAVEEPAEEPAAEEPAAEEPAEEPAAEEPAAEEPAEEPAAEEPAAEEPAEAPAVEEAPVAEVPAVTCNYAVIPTVSIDAVTRNTSVTFTTANFPANSTFSVSMGVYVASWTPESGPHHHEPRHHEPEHREPARPEPRPITYSDDYPQFYVMGSYEPHVPNFPNKESHHGPAPRPDGQPVVSSSFSGTQVGTFETGDGAPQTLTFTIPSSLNGVNPIALWISDLGPCGFYSYNYFYNNSTN